MLILVIFVILILLIKIVYMLKYLVISTNSVTDQILG